MLTNSAVPMAKPPIAKAMVAHSTTREEGSCSEAWVVVGELTPDLKELSASTIPLGRCGAWHPPANVEGAARRADGAFGG